MPQGAVGSYGLHNIINIVKSFTKSWISNERSLKDPNITKLYDRVFFAKPPEQLLLTY